MITMTGHTLRAMWTAIAATLQEDLQRPVVAEEVDTDWYMIAFPSRRGDHRWGVWNDEGDEWRAYLYAGAEAPADADDEPVHTVHTGLAASVLDPAIVAANVARAIAVTPEERPDDQLPVAPQAEPLSLLVAAREVLACWERGSMLARAMVILRRAVEEETRPD